MASIAASRLTIRGPPFIRSLRSEKPLDDSPTISARVSASRSDFASSRRRAASKSRPRVTAKGDWPNVERMPAALATSAIRTL